MTIKYWRSPFYVALVIFGLLIAWISANELSSRYLLYRTEIISKNIIETMRTVNEQIDSVLVALNDVSLSEARCTAKVYDAISKLVATNYLVYEAAVKLPDGSVCSSYGQELDQVPGISSAQRHQGSSRDYWFMVKNISEASGFIVVAKKSGYLWLNKNIVINAMGLPSGVTLDLVDRHSLEPLLSSGIQGFKLGEPFQVGKSFYGVAGVSYVISSQWSDIFVVIGLSSEIYRLSWWGAFLSTLLMYLLVVGALFWLAINIHRHHISLISKIRKALKTNDFSLSYQPIVNMESGEWVGAESLIRWNVSGRSISPGIFIPVAEQEKIIGEITRWVVQQVAEDFSKYFSICEAFYITINLSAQDIEDESFPCFTKKVFGLYGIPAELIVFEVTEGALVNHEKASMQLHRLRAQGHRIAIDDFGTGYSSLAYIQELPADILKIDRSFLVIEKMFLKDAMWRHVVAMAQALNLTIVAEGVECNDQIAELKCEGVLFAQGWFYARELSSIALVSQHNSSRSNYR